MLLFPFVPSLRPLVAQPFSRHVESIPVVVNGAPLVLPFGGGVNSPQHQFVDIDSDGDLDLFVLDVDPPVEFYRNEGTRFAPLYRLRNGAVALPPVSRWMLFYDIDGDGLRDLLTEDSTLVGTSVYKNIGTPHSPQFTRVSPLLRDSSGFVVFPGQNSIPALVDIDADGDYDFFSSNNDGTVNYYQNIGNATTLRLVFRTTRWAGILITGDSCTIGLVMSSHHGASSYRFADFNANGTYDLFIGDLFSTGLFLLLNNGTPTDPRMECNTAHFPTNQPVATAGFNHTTFADIDCDGDLDMFVGVLGGVTQRDGFLFYRNNGSPSAPLLQLHTHNFLTMIDVGMSAHPTFVDIDANGTHDLFVGNLNGQLAYFRNVGTPASPSFLFVDSVYQNIAGGFSYAPTFTDIDADGKKDLFLGLFDGTMRYYRNVGTPQAAQFVRANSPVDTVRVGFNAAPAFADIDADNDLDLFVGNAAGQLRFYRNNGTASNFRPALVSTNFQNTQVSRNAAPAFTDVDGDGDADLFIGTDEGRIEFYENTGSPSNAQFVRRTNHYANTEPALEASPTFADIDGDGDKDLFFGVRRGGIHYYRNERITMSVVEPSRPQPTALEHTYPNPFNSIASIRFQVAQQGHVQLHIFDVTGREVATLVNDLRAPGRYVVQWDASQHPSGVYLYRFTAPTTMQTGRMLLVR